MATQRPTPFLVNAALHDAGLPYEIVRSGGPGSGYYWFAALNDSASTGIPSICQNNLSGWTYDSIVEHVRKHHEQWVEDRAIYALAPNRFIRVGGH